MNHDEFERLVDAAFDEAGSAADRDRLEALIAADPELRGRWDDLRAARAALAGAGLETVPAALHRSLIESARGEGRAPAARGGWLSFVSAAIQVRPAFALGGAVAAGFAIGALGVGLLNGGLRAGDPLGASTSATLPPMPAAAATATVEQGGARLEVTARRRGEETLVRLSARDATPGTVTIAWDPATLRLTAVRWEGNAAPAFEPVPGRVVVRLPEAAGSEWTFEESRAGGGPFRVTLSAAGADRDVTIRAPEAVGTGPSASP